MKRVFSNRHRRNWLIGTIVVLALGIFFLMPTKYYLEIPGGADRISKFVKVEGTRDNDKGSYRLMTVGVLGPASPAMLIWGQLQPFSETLTKNELMGSSTSAEYDELQNYYIKSAANSAVVAAFKAASLPVQIKYQGIYVMSIMAHSNFKGELQLGDTVTAINGRHYDEAQQYIDALKRFPAGTPVTITYTHRGKTQNSTNKLIHLPGTKRAGLGITLTDHTSVVTKPKVRINAGSIGGPSAGLMFALETYDQVSGKNLRRGRTIAGTGTIDNKGNVGVIGGIDKKVYAASKAGATIFFAPDVPATKELKREDPSYVNNYVEAQSTAKKMGSKMKIIPVHSLNEAIKYLQWH
ncbi:SepM family pheromone-processing serine protease [Lacticaseibacillus zhaodongensis]|uniref:SepM family pheromone-processing serine protease n=1 Tax=Lacticaseibacillus zhaodongensis TaxID=2668065 RepID=UPI0012D31A05|nr:SepM family pheromone-processing serine protease [Lacticaseibacillus zhaodongensis]